MPTNQLINQELLFRFLTHDNIKVANLYFEQNPAVNKYSRKQSKCQYSFITTRHGLFAISSSTIGAGSSGRVKVGKHITTGKIVAVKIQPLQVVSMDDCDDCISETEILDQLGQLYAVATRWWNNLVGRKLLSPDEGWLNKYEKEDELKSEKYNFKFYIFSVFFEGITLYKYFKTYRPTIEKTLQIIIKVLEQLKIVHELEIIHGDLSFNNILINKTSDGQIEINLIDFGLAGKLKNGIIRYQILDYKFNKKNYPSPECDYRRTLYQILPELRHNAQLSIPHSKFYTIYRWAQKGYGFNTTASDLYSLGWNIYYFANGHNDPILRGLHEYLYQLNPFKRKSLQFMMNQYKEQLNKLESKKIVDELIDMMLASALDHSRRKDSLNRTSSVATLNYSFSSGSNNNGLSSSSLDVSTDELAEVIDKKTSRLSPIIDTAKLKLRPTF